MSDAVFPELPGLTWDREKNPEFKTVIQTSASGCEKSAAMWVYPKWHFKLSYEFLRDDGTMQGELQQLIGFFLARRGDFDTWLYRDPEECRAVNQVIALGDGVTKEFQLVRNFAGLIEPVFGIKVKPTILVAGAAAEFDFNTWGLITFTDPPPDHAQIVATFDYYYRVRFKNSMMELNQFVKSLWSAKTVEFASVKRQGI